MPRFIRITNPQHHKEKEVVRCIITNYSYQDCDAEIVDVIGSATDIGIDIAQIAIKYDFELNFPDDVLQEARDLSFSLEDELKRRVEPNIMIKPKPIQPNTAPIPVWPSTTI